jgi:hypothetical protein
VRLLKRELLFIAFQMAAKLDLPRMEILAKLHQLTTQKGKEPLPPRATPPSQSVIL